MLTIEESIERILTWAETEGITRNRLAKLANLSKHALRNMGASNWNPTRNTIKALERAMADYERDDKDQAA